ncbi:MAG: hypothetical protein OEU94_11155 [Aquincola sp.]|nr:hypothetical protein [Aquincola sp.]MDH4289861.1 hypothetical protein [Aquincola sp.]MDH5328839.1 hypothetical protein [Aquincola sp.]
MKYLALLTVALLGIAIAPALAQGKKVYRCEAGGKVEYSDAPCKGAAEVAADDARTKAQRDAAVQTVQREEKLAEKMARERHAAEAAASRQGAVIIPHASAAQAAAASAPASKKRAQKKPAARPAPPQS